jgi:hypothetical protein
MKPQHEQQDSIRHRAAQESLESATHDTGRGAEATPGHDTPHAERTQRLAVEQRRLKEWAETKGKLKGALLSEDARGGEHVVRYDERSGRFFKATRPETQMGYGIAYGSFCQGATPSEYLDRLVIHNRIFGDDVRLERIVPVGGKLSIITSQPAIKGRDAVQAEIDGLMTDKGFERIGLGTYYHAGEGLLVHDLLPKNVKVGKQDGMVQPIDPVIQRVTPEFAEFLRQHPIAGEGGEGRALV